MLPFTKANWISLTGLAVAGAGVVLYTHVENILETLKGSAAHDIFPLASFATTLGGLLMALAGSVVWARRASLRQPLWLAVSIGIGCILIGLVGDINVHQASGILLFPLLFAVIDLVLLVAVTYW
jgi:hypothetical protein